MSAREEFLFRKQVQNARELINKKRAQILFKEYLIELFKKCISESNEEGQKFLNKNIKNLEKDIFKLNQEIEELSVIANNVYDKEEKETKLSEDILKLAEETSKKIKEFESLEIDFQIKKVFFEELEKQISLLRKKSESLENNQIIEILNTIVCCLEEQRGVTEKEYLILKEKYQLEDKKCWEALAKLYDVLDQYQRQKGE